MSLQERSPTMSDRHYVHHEDEVALAKLLKESKPFLEKYGTTIIYGIAAVLAIAAVVVYIQQKPAPTAEVSRDLMLAKSTEDFQAVADNFSDSPIGILARLRQADSELEDAVSKLFTDREASKVSLENAEKAYKQLEERKDVNDSIRERVLVGLARISECRCDGSDDSMIAATSAWQRVLKAYPDSKNFKAIAEARIKRLATDDSRKFYAWFATQNPKPEDDLLMPQDGLPGQVPAEPAFPSLQNLGLPTLGASASGSTPSATTKKDDAAEPTEKPAEEKVTEPAEATTPEPAATPTPDAPKAESPPAAEVPVGDAAPAEPTSKDDTPAPATPEKSGE